MTKATAQPTAAPTSEPTPAPPQETEGPKEILIESVVLDNEKMNLATLEEAVLTACVMPEDTTERYDIQWSSSDETVVTVSSRGEIRAVGNGTATITATAGTHTGSCDITVSNPTIATAEELLAIPEFKEGVVYEIVADIDMKGVKLPEEKACIEGVLEGNGQRIYNLEEQIELLLQTYPGPTDVNKRNGASVAASYSSDHGVHTSEAYDTFPVISGDTYYWCRFSLMYENDEDASEIGVTQVLFFTAESYCECRYTDGWKYPSERGLTVFAEDSLDCEVRAIQGNPHKYKVTGRVPGLDAAVQFLEENNSYSAFVEHFGEPNAVDIYYFYGLPMENGEPRYLVLSVTEKTDSIRKASVADDLEWLEIVWEKEE
ncbi:MAG: Ig-like domain-containing protein [Lachnospiraceae bacterium]|nr:Ig-like domain-containing protein [Lachnospiraceae bacterium]